MSNTIRRTGLFLPTALSLAGLAVLIGLGTWQLQRKAWKEGLMARIEARSKAAPEPIASLMQRDRDAADVEYARIEVTGQYKPVTLWLFATEKSVAGWHVYTPLAYAPDAFVWVNRGFVPGDPAKEPRVETPTEPVTVVGLARAAASPGLFTPENDAARNRWYWRDLPAMSQAARLEQAVRVAPFSLDAEAGRNGTPAGGYPRGGTTIVKLPNRHLEYAITWYGLALTLVGVFLAFAWGRLRAPSASGAD